MASNSKAGKGPRLEIAPSEQPHRWECKLSAQNSVVSGTEKVPTNDEEGKPKSYPGDVRTVEDKGRTSWNRSLSTRGRTSIVLAACFDKQQLQGNQKGRGKPPIPKGRNAKVLNLEKERAYFEELDLFELAEESPSPKNFTTWSKGTCASNIPVPPLSSVFKRWLGSKSLTCSHRSRMALMETPEGYHGGALRFSESRTCKGARSGEDVEFGMRKLSLVEEPPPSLFGDYSKPHAALLSVCGQSEVLAMEDIVSKYCLSEKIVKVGEGTYGEAFRVGKTVFKVVPVDGDFIVNGEVQKTSKEILEEAVLSKTLNLLRADNGADAYNHCTCFINTIDLKVCRGPYVTSFIRAWEDWDTAHGSENDHPRDFPDDSCYVVFILEHGGQDLESFTFSGSDEAKSVLAQVTVALAIAEAALEFEHRDLHWGNILLGRGAADKLVATLQGRRISLNTFGLSVSIIDFTFSRMNTGDEILFLDLSADPDLFQGPKSDKQVETYRKMREVTNDCWEGSFPSTNVLWLQYLVHILLSKKLFDQPARDLRALKKRLGAYDSARDVLFDSFFEELLVYDAPQLDSES